METQKTKLKSLKSGGSSRCSSSERSRAPSAARSEVCDSAQTCREEVSSGSDSCFDLPLAAFAKKRPLSPECSGTEIGTEVPRTANRRQLAKRGRAGRPLTPIVGLADQARRRAEREAREAEKDDRIEEATRKVVARREQMSMSGEARSSVTDDMTAAQLRSWVKDALEAILLVSSKSKGLKGTCQRTLKQAANAIGEAAEALANRTCSEEAEKLQAENIRLSAEIAALKRQQDDLRADIEKQQEERHKDAKAEMAAMRREMAALRSSLSVIEGRVLRPPLAADRQGENRMPPPMQPPPSYAAKAAAHRTAATTAAPRIVAATAANKAPQGSKVPSRAPPPLAKAAPHRPKGPSKKAPPPNNSSRPGPTVTSHDGWQTVRSNKAEKRRRYKANRRARRQASLKNPRSTAVVITLQPAAVERGETYAGLLKTAKAAIDPKALGIEKGLRCRVTQTGARLLEVPGADSGDKADRLAENLRKILPAADARVTRPQKCADLRIGGLDDSATVEELVDAVAKAGMCPTNQIRCAAIRRERSGLGTAIVNCPVKAAKKVSEGRLLVGFMSVRASLLPSRPLRCFRCMSDGHVGVKCTAGVDCSGRCWKCGQPGHTAGVCEAEPHCFVCASADKPADHRASAKCTSPARPRAGLKNAVPAAKEVESNMETN